ncbi:hypothetical protein BDM02DRAFT_2144413 [Thelephora ganbajun]|uniref:Uncharacterized protein n=1 Tax=Thelephora ganbajun TaxID=370292 RepID=A0ACB6ZUS0_THEGA|nr:hypothetical protein BDM02DRAFT_2144413 [Thelephora ganbajun]
MSYPATTEYSSYGYTNPDNQSQSHIHVVSPSNRVENGQRKRPKYTRSKTGCMTCRGKKIKCDETKPNCLRCTHGQRECTWPEGVPTRKRSTTTRKAPSRDAYEITRPSTAGSSEQSGPPTRDVTPKREHIELALPSQSVRRATEPLIQIPSTIGEDLSVDRRASVDVSSSQYAYPNGLPSLPPSMPDRSYSYHHISNNSYYDPRVPRQLPDHRQHQYHHHVPSIPNHIDPIDSFFPTVQERNLIRHYCDHSMNFIMAVPFENPMVASVLPLILSCAPGDDLAIDSLRLSLLGVASVHQSFLLSRSQACSDSAKEYMLLAHMFRLKSKQTLAEACTTPHGAQSDAALGASLAISLMDILAGGHNWAKNLTLAKTLVNVRGGPEMLLSRSAADEAGLGTSNGVFRAKLMLEILAVTGRGLLVRLESTPSYVENLFGISRGLVPLLARTTRFLSKHLSPLTEVSESGETVIDDGAGCEELYSMLQEWVNDRSCATSPRVQAGNLAYGTAFQVALLRDVMCLPVNDPTVQQKAKGCLVQCLECVKGRMGVDLIWPVIISGTQVCGTNRTVVMDILAAFREQCCYEVDTAEKVILQVWKRLDDEHPHSDWRSVMDESQLRVLFV